ncbi:stage III sporulation protein AC [Alkalibacillus sp. S2W]|uniref:Stage III sporulation protein AC n=1 Tax=Alkalibacillus salilacus TaxID=284582 RepID=A0ABT9VCC6_9BACI|nr:MULTISPECIES: stage III sporulation protein AC [Alkalibacillus]MDQ0158596.1 stage III sporulation protein AC [Alkalibacillus salilacus]NIK12419.1 stage III sporulation protein AC [Alkalibacillus almallahensis]
MSDVFLLFQVAGIGIIVAMLSALLKQMGKDDLAQWVTLIGFIIVLVIVIDYLGQLFQQIRSVFLFQMML